MNLIRVLEKYGFISFDVFDTLIIRKARQPEEVFRMVERDAIPRDAAFEGFASKRVRAAKKAFENREKEATLKDIYNYLDYSPLDKKRLMEWEIAKEIEVATPNPTAVCILKRMKAEGKTIVIASDMYLPTDCVAKILEKNGIPFDYLYVSADIQARKSNGAMFRHIQRELGITRKDIFHIGDNPRSDVLVPRLMGIKSYRWTDNPFSHLRALNKLDTACAGKLLERLTDSDDNRLFYRIGFSLFGPALFGFCAWIRQTAELENFSEICFLSRDGQIIREAYELLFHEERPYLLISRRAVTTPLLKDAQNMDDILARIPYIKRLESVSDFLYKIGVENADIKAELVEEYGETISRDALKERGEEIFQKVREAMRANAAKEYEAALRYMRDNIRKGRVALVDIGWYGTMQKSLERLCAKEAGYSFQGLYFGLMRKKNVNEDIDAKGYAYDFRSSRSFDAELIHGFNGLIELMFTANHGSAKRYALENNVATCELEENHGEYGEFVKDVREGALDFIRVWKEERCPLDCRTAYAPLHDLLSRPTEAECAALGDLKFYDVYCESIIRRDGWGALFGNPKREIGNFMKSNWKIGYIKETFPALTRPDKLYRLLNRIAQRRK